MKDKHLYQKRKDGKYLGYTEDGFYYNSDEGLWCWEQTSKEVIHKAKTIEELREIKKQNLIGSGNYEHVKDTALPEGLVGTEEFAKLTKIEKMSKEYVSRLLKRATAPHKEYDERGMDRKKRGIHFVNCLKKAGIEYDQILHKSKYFKRKVWVFKKVNDDKIKKFKEYWYTKNNNL